MFKWLKFAERLKKHGMNFKENIPDFRVTHQAIRETDGSTVCSKLAMRVVTGDLVHIRSVGVLDGIPLDAFLRRDTPAIVDATKHVNQ